MFDAAASRRITARELNGLIDIARGLDDSAWEAPTRCAQWTVRDLCAHAAIAAHQQAEAFRRANKGLLEPPDYPGAPELSTPDMLDLLRSGARDLDAALGDLNDVALTGMTPLPFGVVPTVVALQIPVYEYAFHRDDLATATGGHGGLPEDVAAAYIAFFPGLAPMLAGRADPGDCGYGYRLVAPSGTIVLVPAPDGWTIAGSEPDIPLCTIQGADDAIALFTMGRIPATDARLEISGPVGAAEQFKRWLPGP